MTIGDIATVCALCGSLLVPSGYGLKYYADHEYVTISGQNLSLLYAAEDELAELRSRAVCDSACIARKATLEERIRNLKK